MACVSRLFFKSKPCLAHRCRSCCLHLGRPGLNPLPTLLALQACLEVDDETFVAEMDEHLKAKDIKFNATAKCPDDFKDLARVVYWSEDRRV